MDLVAKFKDQNLYYPKKSLCQHLKPEFELCINPSPFQNFNVAKKEKKRKCTPKNLIIVSQNYIGKIGVVMVLAPKKKCTS